MNIMKIYRGLFCIILCGVIFFFVFYNFPHVFLNGYSSAKFFLSEHIKISPENQQYVVFMEERGKTVSKGSVDTYLPNLSQYTFEDVAARTPEFKKGKVQILEMESVPEARKFVTTENNAATQRLSRMEVRPTALVIQSGNYDFQMLYKEVMNLLGDNQRVLLKQGKTYTLRIPLIICKGSGLTISGDQIEALLLSQERGSFIANRGNFIILKSKIMGWNESSRQLAPLTKKNSFRPFVVSWNGGRMDAANSLFSHLGYFAGRSYGFSYVSCTDCFNIDSKEARATGILVGNTFRELYYGFYSFEAEDIIIVGNTYENNIVYGIDPHDDSKRLIIAKNHSYGTKNRHGIIISRQVNDSWIFENWVHHNAGSGIVIDRMSQHNIIHNNVSSHNKFDGIAFFESPHNKISNNKVYANQSVGIRVRNSWDILSIKDSVTDNVGMPFVIYSASVDGGSMYRNVTLDPYVQRADINVEDSIIKTHDNGSIFKIQDIEKMTVSGLTILSEGNLLDNNINEDQKRIMKNIGQKDKVFKILKKTWFLEFLNKAKTILSRENHEI